MYHALSIALAEGRAAGRPDPLGQRIQDLEAEHRQSLEQIEEVRSFDSQRANRLQRRDRGRPATAVDQRDLAQKVSGPELSASRLRRHPQGPRVDVLQRLAAHELRRDGHAVRLRPKEFQLLAMLAAHPGGGHSRGASCWIASGGSTRLATHERSTFTFAGCPLRRSVSLTIRPIS